eukprot:gene28247-31351_t
MPCRYYSLHQSRWIHLDSCEAAFDKPLLYEQGWGKKLVHVIAVGTDGFSDVGKRYSRDWDAVVARREADGVLESWLADKIKEYGLGGATVAALDLRDLGEQLELMECFTSKPTAADMDLPGRTTGSQQWRDDRGETGSLCTKWLDFASLCTKWLDFGGGGASGTAWLEWRAMKGKPALEIISYDLVSANDGPERDPASWVLEGVMEKEERKGGNITLSLEDDPEWVELDKRSGAHFSERGELQCFHVPKPVAVKWLRLRITATRDPASANSVQLACFNLFEAGTGAAKAVGSSIVAAVSAGFFDTQVRSLLTKILTNLDLPMSTKILTNLTYPPTALGSEARTGAAKAAGSSVMAAVSGGFFDTQVESLVQAPCALALLSVVGFRPLILPDDAPNAQPQSKDVFLIASGGAEAAAAVAAACEGLKSSV